MIGYFIYLAAFLLGTLRIAGAFDYWTWTSPTVTYITATDYFTLPAVLCKQSDGLFVELNGGLDPTLDPGIEFHSVQVRPISFEACFSEISKPCELRPGGETSYEVLCQPVGTEFRVQASKQSPTEKTICRGAIPERVRTLIDQTQDIRADLAGIDACPATLLIGPGADKLISGATTKIEIPTSGSTTSEMGGSPAVGDAPPISGGTRPADVPSPGSSTDTSVAVKPLGESALAEGNAEISGTVSTPSQTDQEKASTGGRVQPTQGEEMQGSGACGLQIGVTSGFHLPTLLPFLLLVPLWWKRRF